MGKVEDLPDFIAVNYKTGELTPFRLVASHTSTVRIGEMPTPHPDCPGCKALRSPVDEMDGE